jgi:hypothetical protein
LIIGTGADRVYTFVEENPAKELTTPTIAKAMLGQKNSALAQLLGYEPF